MVKKSELQVGKKYSHANGVCMYAGSKDTKFWEGQVPEPYAIFVFKVPTDRVYVPIRSLNLIASFKKDSNMTRMIVPDDNPMTDSELIEMFLK